MFALPMPLVLVLEALVVEVLVVEVVVVLLLLTMLPPPFPSHVEEEEGA